MQGETRQASISLVECGQSRGFFAHSQRAYRRFRSVGLVIQKDDVDSFKTVLCTFVA